MSEPKPMTADDKLCAAFWRVTKIFDTGRDRCDGQDLALLEKVGLMEQGVCADTFGQDTLEIGEVMWTFIPQVYQLRDIFDKYQAATIAARSARIAELEAERNEYRSMFNETLGLVETVISGKPIACVFCGETYAVEKDTAPAETARKHVMCCPAHPLRKAEAERDALREALRQIGVNGSVPDQPAHSPLDEASYIRRHVADLRCIAIKALSPAPRADEVAG